MVVGFYLCDTLFHLITTGSNLSRELRSFTGVVWLVINIALMTNTQVNAFSRQKY